MISVEAKSGLEEIRMLDLLYRRRSIRRYQDLPVSQEHLEQIIDAALLSPSSRGRQPWEFLVVTDMETLEKLSQAKKGAHPLKNAPVGIVVIADPEKSDVWVEDTSIAMTHMWLTAEALGLGACWIQIRMREYSPEESAENYVRKILDIPANRQVEAILACGYPDESRPLRTKEDLKRERIFLNRYGVKA